MRGRLHLFLWHDRVAAGGHQRAGHHARAVEAINVRIDASAIDLTDALERPKSEGDRIQVSTAPGADGIIRRIDVDHALRVDELGRRKVAFE